MSTLVHHQGRGTLGGVIEDSILELSEILRHSNTSETPGQRHGEGARGKLLLKFLGMRADKAVSVIGHAEMKAMAYSVNQINNLLRTYPQHLKIRPTLLGEETSASHDPSSVDRVSISPEGRRLLQDAETKRSTSGSQLRPVEDTRCVLHWSCRPEVFSGIFTMLHKLRCVRGTCQTTSIVTWTR